MYKLHEGKSKELIVKNITKELKVVNIKVYEENTEKFNFIKENLHGF